MARVMSQIRIITNEIPDNKVMYRVMKATVDKDDKGVVIDGSWEEKCIEGRVVPAIDINALAEVVTSHLVANCQGLNDLRITISTQNY